MRFKGFGLQQLVMVTTDLRFECLPQNEMPRRCAILSVFMVYSQAKNISTTLMRLLVGVVQEGHVAQFLGLPVKFAFNQINTRS